MHDRRIIMVPQSKRKRKFEPRDFALQVKRSRAGLGLFTNDPIRKGACVIEYTGREISDAEQYTNRSQYLFEIGKDRMIDGRVRSNTARYINHSCRPNCEVEIYRHRVYVLARRAIRPGEELTYDYGKEFFDEHIKPKGCRCEKCSPLTKNKQ